ncbi:MAG TPA: nickel-dependent hydrogenase large subunit [Thermoanaerobaculia bacterium]|nr:nickel-dependent hydrogenase large subunit [Thermoanaerobaculia bacterium]
MTRQNQDVEGRELVEVNWDPITRIVGNLGIYTKIDFANREVVECKSTSSLFRGYSVFMKGKDPRDAGFITSRICGICGDNHTTCSNYAQQMAYGIWPPPLAEWIVNLGEAAEFMFDHTIFQDNLVFVDFCEQMVKETNPGLLARAESTPAPKAEIHGYRTIADIMRAFNPFEGEIYKEGLGISRTTREMFCLMEGRHVHPSTLYPGGVGTVATPQVFTDYQVRLLRILDFVKQSVAVNDDVFDFFYEALPGYEEVGRRRILLGCWGTFNDPEVCDYRYENMADWGRQMFVTPGVIVDGELVTNSLVDINLGIRILLGSSFYDDWEGEETFVKEDPLGNPVDRRHPWNQTTLPHPQRRDIDGEGGKYSWVMSPRWYHQGEHLPLETGGGALARLWSTALNGLVDTPYVKATGSSVRILLPKSHRLPEMELEWKIPPWVNTIERDRARVYFVAYAAAMALHFLDKAMDEVRAGRTKVFTDFDVPEEAIGCGFHEAVRGVLSHHLVIRDGKIANYHPYPPTPWNGSPRDSFGTPGPYEDAVQGLKIFEENGRDDFKGIDILRTVRSFDPCLPCGVHMYLGAGKTLQVQHSPMFGAVHGGALPGGGSQGGKSKGGNSQGGKSQGGKSQGGKSQGGKG